MAEQAGPTVGVVKRNKKRQMIPYENDSASKLAPRIGKATKVSGGSV